MRGRYKNSADKTHCVKTVWCHSNGSRTVFSLR